MDAGMEVWAMEKRLWIYMVLTFGLAWGLLEACVLASLKYEGSGMRLCLSVYMLLPAISSLLTYSSREFGNKK